LTVLNILLLDPLNLVINNCVKFVYIQIPEARPELMSWTQINKSAIVLKSKNQIN
jgi:hypothetical protein